MKRRTLLASSISLGFAGLPLIARAGTQVAPSNRVNLFLDATSPFVAADWTLGSTPSLGAVKILKSTGNSTYFLLLNLPTNVGIAGSGKRFLLDSITNVGSVNARISDTLNSATGQCVDFAKSMIGSIDLTNKWHAGTKLGSIPNAQLAAQLAPGTMIAYFGTSPTSASLYSSVGQHVAIVLSIVKDAAGNPTGVNVVDENYLNGFTVTANGTSGSSPQTISKHLLKWTDGTSGIRSASQYNIVDLY